MMDEKLQTADFSGGVLLHSPSAFTSFRIAASRMIAQISRDGEVLIDWNGVDAVITNPQSGSEIVAYARLMRACRDGTWKPLGAKGEE